MAACGSPGIDDAPAPDPEGHPTLLAAYAALNHGDRAAASERFLKAAKDPAVRLDALEGALGILDQGPVVDLVFEIDAALSSERDPERLLALRTFRLETNADRTAREAAIRQLDRDTGEHSPWPLTALARLQEDRGSFAGAASEYSRAIERNDQCVRAWRGLARCRLASKDPNGAVTALAKAVALSPNDPLIRYNLGRLLLDRPTGARDARIHLRAATTLLPDDVPILVALSVACMRVDEPKEAEVALLHARELAPQDPDVHFNLGVLYADKLSRPEAAVESFHRYLELGGEDRARVERWLKQLEKPGS